MNKRYRCLVCEHIYDPAVGDPNSGIAPGTPFEQIPDSWSCPECGATKADFELDLRVAVRQAAAQYVEDSLGAGLDGLQLAARERRADKLHHRVHGAVHEVRIDAVPRVEGGLELGMISKVTSSAFSLQEAGPGRQVVGPRAQPAGDVRQRRSQPSIRIIANTARPMVVWP